MLSITVKHGIAYRHLCYSTVKCEQVTEVG